MILVMSEFGRIEMQDLNEKHVLDSCRNELPQHAMPSQIIFIDTIPMTAVGKVDYCALEQRL